MSSYTQKKGIGELPAVCDHHSALCNTVCCYQEDGGVCFKLICNMCVLERASVVKRNPSLASLSHLVCREHWTNILGILNDDAESVPQVEVINPKLKEGIHYSVGASNLVELKPFMTTGQLLGSPEADDSLCIASNGPGDIRVDSDDDDISIEHPPRQLM